MGHSLIVVALGLAGMLGLPVLPRTLEVGPGRAYQRVEQAVAAAKAGDTILVYPREEGRAYEQTALLVRTPNLTIRAVPPAATDGVQGRVQLSGEGFDYSGIGNIPRAIVQFSPGADGCTLEGFELVGAHNDSHNGAGLRIDRANHITAAACNIHGNDMGIMSAGDGTPNAGVDQFIERCLIFGNGSLKEPGQNHNLYLGGTSVIISACEVRGSLVTGHNIKSRAHYTRIEYCWVHDSANRELDLVDGAGDTDSPGSDAIVLGCIIAKAKNTAGNRETIHFGQDGGHDHTGTLHIVNSTILSPYISPVVTLSAAGASVAFHNNLFTDGGSGQKNQVLVGAAGKKDAKQLAECITLASNVFCGGFPDAVGVRLIGPVVFADAAAGDFRIVSPKEGLQGRGVDISQLALPPAPGRAHDTPGLTLSRYSHPQALSPRGDDKAPDVGACGVQH